MPQSITSLLHHYITMNKVKAFIKPIAGLLAVGLLIYFFPDIFLYFAIAIILSMLGRPLCELIKKFHIKKFYLGDSLSAVLTMVAMFLTFSLIFLIIIPLVNKEILILSKNTLFCFYKWAKYYNKH